MTVDSIPDWIDHRHICKGEVRHCAHCLRDGEEVELEVEDRVMESGWMGVNWETGFCEKVRCPECGHTGHIRTKKMKRTYSRGNFRFVCDGVAARPEGLRL